MKMPVIVILAFCLLSLSNAISFRRVAEIPGGAVTWTRAIGFDTDQDGKQNLVFGSRADHFDDTLYIHFWEHIGFDRYVLEDSTDQWLPISDIGFLDSDSLVDMVGKKFIGPMYVYESPVQNSHPTDIVWYDSVFDNIGGGNITDLDQDGLKEILFRYSWYRTSVYENTGDNQYSLVWQDTVHQSSRFVDGDFDLDGRTEFITGFPGPGGGAVNVWECIGDNDYQLVFNDTIFEGDNNTDVFVGNDMDGNGKPEFLFTSIFFFSGTAHLFCYETIGDNDYDYFMIDSISLPFIIGTIRSTCGDVDADGIEEIVWPTCNQWHIYKASGVHQYQRIYSSSPVTWQEDAKMSVYDLNENGYPEVIESWFINGEPYWYHGTRIWEIEGVRLHQPNGGEILKWGEVYPITWEKFAPPGADSFTLFISLNNGVDYDTIATIPNADDTMYMWTVPDSVTSESCKVMIWAYGPPRSGEEEPRGTAWDFSDTVFAITETGIEEGSETFARGFSLKILQNPVLNNNVRIQFSVPRLTKVKLVIYNTLGQVENVLVDGKVNPGTHELILNKKLPSGVYFIKFEAEGYKETKKVVLLK